MSGLTKMLLMAVAGSAIGILHQAEPLASWEEGTVDLRLQLRPREKAPGVIGIVAASDEDVKNEQFGGWPFPRSIHADVVKILRALGAEHITFDVIFSGTTAKDDDEAFAAAVEGREDITLAYYFNAVNFREDSGDTDGEPRSSGGTEYGMDGPPSQGLVGRDPEPLAFRAASTAAANVKPDGNDSVFRRVPMFIRHRGELRPGLAMETLIRTLDIGPDQIRIIPGSQIILEGTRAGTLRIPVDKHLRYRVNYTSGAGEFEPAFGYLDLYRAVRSPEWAAPAREAIEGNPVIVGNVSTGSSDIVTTPIGRLPGMLVHATAVSNILTQNHLRFIPFWMQVAALGLAGSLLGLMLRLSSSLLTVIITLALTAGWTATVLYLARSDWMLPLLPFLELTIIAMVGSLWNQAGVARNETDRTRRALQKYVSPPVAERALRQEALLDVDTERCEITVFFSDIRGFTSWTENNDPEDVTDVLNEYLEAMTGIIYEHGGTLDKFVGDCVMVIFNAPTRIEDHAVKAVEMAVAMQGRIKDLSRNWSSRGRAPVTVGMGINTGQATVGNFGSDAFSDYTAIGNCVNLAARIESLSKAGEILVSEYTRTLIDHAFSTEVHGEHRLKGVGRPTMVYRVVPDREAGNPGPAVQGGGSEFRPPG